MPPEDAKDSRTSSPSLSQRVRSITTLRSRFSSSSRTVMLDDAPIESRTTSSASDYGRLSPDSSRTMSTSMSDDRMINGLQPSRSLYDRIRMIEAINQDAVSYPLPRLMSIWEPIEDLWREDAVLEARKACFSLAATIAGMKELPIETQSQLYKIIVVPVQIELLGEQVSCLKILTRRGARTVPFSPDIGRFLTSSLGRHFSMATTARKAASKKRDRESSERDPASAIREKGLSSLFSLIANIESQSPGAFQDEDQSALLEELFAIGEKTSYLRDMKNVITVLAPIVRASGVPEHQRAHCVQLLCAISNAVKDEVNEQARAAILVMLKSDYKDAVVRILLENLSLALNERHTAIVCGSLSMLLELIKNKSQGDLPRLTFGEFIQPFSLVHYGSRATRSACLQTISDLLADPGVSQDVLSSDWKVMVDAILTATGDEIYEPGQKQPLSIEGKMQNGLPPTTSSSSATETQDFEPHREDGKQKRFAHAILESLQHIATSINSLWSSLNQEQRELVARFYDELIDVLPETHLLQLINIILQQKENKMPLDFYIPGTPVPKLEALPRKTYHGTMDELIDLFIQKHKVPASAYARIMEALRDDLKTTNQEMNEERIRKLANTVTGLLGEFDQMQEGSGWQKAAELAQTVAVAWKLDVPENFEHKLNRLCSLLDVRPDAGEAEAALNTESISMYKAQSGIANVTVALVDIFLQYLPDYSERTTLLFKKFIRIASDDSLSASIRLPALRLLARIRCDQRYAIFITPHADSLSLASSLRRTEGSKYQLATFQQDTSSNNNKTTHTFKSVHASKTEEQAKALRRSRKSLETVSKPQVKPPLWMYPGGPGLPQAPPPQPSSINSVYIPKMNESGTFDMVDWLVTAMQVIQSEKDWEVYSYVVTHLPSQLTNSSLFDASISSIKMLRNIIVSQLSNGNVHEPPPASNVQKGDVAFCLMQSLLILMGYADNFSQNEQDEMVKAVLQAIGTWDRVGQVGIQALTVACHVMPTSIEKMMGAILLKLERYITTTNLTVDILEFLGGIPGIPGLHNSLPEDEHRRVFAICTRYLAFAREERSRLSLSSGASKEYSAIRFSDLSLNGSTDIKSKVDDPHKDLSQYVYQLAYHVISYWFMTLTPKQREEHIDWIASNLIDKDSKGMDKLDEQDQITLDMLYRTTFSGLGETKPVDTFTKGDGPRQKRDWICGLSILSIETAEESGKSEVTKRQISGTTYAAFQLLNPPIPSHYVDMNRLSGPNKDPAVLPQHILLQMTSSIAPTPGPMQPIPLPNDPKVKRAMEAFDRLDTVDGYRIGVIYVSDGQSTEQEILSNRNHSYHFTRFLEGLGGKVALKDALFNTQGLDNIADSDGTHTYAWRDRLLEVVYHVPTMMPNLEHDRARTNKKRHIGNNHVNIVWNESGLPFGFDTIPSEFNSVNIVITPENSQSATAEMERYIVKKEGENADTDDPRYIVNTVTKSGYPRLSPCASAKLVSLTRLSPLVRQMALNGAIFTNVWTHREDGDYASSWKNRLRELVKFRERWGESNILKNPDYYGTSRRRVYARGGLFRGRIEMGGLAEEDDLAGGLDFTRWSGRISGNTRIE